MEQNKIELLQEDIACVHKYLDSKKIPKIDENGKTYSLIGRIKLLESKLIKDASEVETNYLK